MTAYSESGAKNPDVTVGLPVYNGAKTIARAIEAILNQTHQALCLVISDNASNDGTQEICASFAARDPRVKYIRHEQNQGAISNFRFVLEQAHTPYFMWSAHDDWLESDVIAQCRRVLVQNTDASGALPETFFFSEKSSPRRARGEVSLRGAVAFRLARFLMRPADNSRFYGLYNTSMLRRSFPSDLREVPGADWVISALTLVYGAHIKVSGAYLYRSAAEPGRYAQHLQSASVSDMDRFIPTATMSRELLRQLSFPNKVAAIPSLLLLAFHQAVWLRWVKWRMIRSMDQ